MRALAAYGEPNEADRLAGLVSVPQRLSPNDVTMLVDEGGDVIALNQGVVQRAADSSATNHISRRPACLARFTACSASNRDERSGR